MTWLVAIALAGSVFAALWALKVPRGGREAIGAAIMVGIAAVPMEGSAMNLRSAQAAPARLIATTPPLAAAMRRSSRICSSFVHGDSPPWGLPSWPM